MPTGNKETTGGGMMLEGYVYIYYAYEEIQPNGVDDYGNPVYYFIS